MILTEEEQIVSKIEEEVAQKKKDIPGETEEIKTYDPVVNSASSKC